MWDWRRCSRCGRTETWKHGTESRHPWLWTGRERVRVQRWLERAGVPAEQTRPGPVQALPRAAIWRPMGGGHDGAAGA